MSALVRKTWMVILTTAVGIGCASPRVVRVAVPVPVLPSCDVPNSFEQCVYECGQQGKRASESWENGDRRVCICAPFKASWNR